MVILIISESILIHCEEALLGPGECIWLTSQRWEVRWLCAARPDRLGTGCSSRWDRVLVLALMFKLSELCSSMLPNLGEVRHMESREQC